MDVANKPQEKLMSFQARWYKAEIESLKAPAVNPPSTLKTEAAKEKRRQELEYKLYLEQLKAREEMERDYKQKRVTQRVKCSPALVDNQAALQAQWESNMEKNW